jgi:hypothetical protein
LLARTSFLELDLTVLFFLATLFTLFFTIQNRQ